MSWEEEKGQYIVKLEGIVDGIDKILNLQGNSVVTTEMSSTLIKKRKVADELLNKLRKNEFEIAVVGLEKAGKSSFSNAFIELQALPTDEQRCTYTSTCIRYSVSGKASVKFYSRQEFTTDFRQKLEVLGIPDVNLYSPDNLTLDKYVQLFEECDETKKQLYQDSLNQDIRDTIQNWSDLKKYVGRDTMEFSEREIDSDDFKKYITSPSRAIAVKDVVIYTKKFQSMENAVMYDVPGFNSPTQMHQEQTLQKMKSADAIIMVAKADEPSITGDVLKVFKKSDMDGELLSQKLFVFANKADRAVNLEKNKAVTYDEWLQKRAIMPNTEASRERIVFGSANAHLGEKAPHGLDARKRLEDQRLTDGIETLRNKLNVYYKTTRFEVLKKRVGKIMDEVVDLFEDKKDLYVCAGTQYDYSEIANLSLKLNRELSQNLAKSLARLKDAINDEARQNKPLAARIEESIRETVTKQKYRISQEEIKQKHIQIAGIGAAEQPQKIDSAIREERFSLMYDDFSENILSNTSEKHGEECEKIIDIFMDAMHVSKSSTNYEKLKSEIITHFAINTKQEITFYQSLIERFARDLMEVQIKFAHGTDRLNKFKEEAANFLSMGVFYSASISDAARKEDIAYIYSSPSDSPLWRRILYPEHKEEDRTSIIAEFKKLTGLERLNERIDGLISKLIQANGVDSAKALLIKNFAEFAARKVPPVALAGEVARVLQSICGEGDDDAATLLKDIIEGNRYLTDIAKKHSTYSYETVIKEFDDDIDALQCVLINAFKPAVNIDKAFSARESKLIEDIIHDVQSDKFDEFIAHNLNLIASSKLDEIHQSQEQMKLNAAVMNEIRTILDRIASN